MDRPRPKTGRPSEPSSEPGEMGERGEDKPREPEIGSEEEESES
jgi:hypothetical protein